MEAPRCDLIFLFIEFIGQPSFQTKMKLLVSKDGLAAVVLYCFELRA